MPPLEYKFETYSNGNITLCQDFFHFLTKDALNLRIIEKFLTLLDFGYVFITIL